MFVGGVRRLMGKLGWPEGLMMVCCWAVVEGVVVLAMAGGCEMDCQWLPDRMAEARLVCRRGLS